MSKANYLFSICILLVLFSCQNQSPENNASKTMNTNSPAQWLFYEGSTAIKKNKSIVLVSGDEEYRSEEALPQLAKILANQHGFDCTVLFSQNPDKPGVIDPNYSSNIPGLEHLDKADLMILSTRFRALPDEQMQYFQKYLTAGKPIIGLRTATHAFHFKDTTSNWRHWGNYSQGIKEGWDGGFGRKILGVNWHSHHGHHKHQSTRGVMTSADAHPILSGIEARGIWGPTDVYGAPLTEESQTILFGQVINREGVYDENDLLFGMRETDTEIASINPAAKNAGNPNDPLMPIVWSKPYQLSGGKSGLSITSTIGSSTDLLDEDLRRLFVNASYFLLEMDVPSKTSAELEGKYQPTQFNFHDDAYWDEKDLRVEE